MSSLLNIKAFLKRTQYKRIFGLCTHNSVDDSKSEPNAHLPLSQCRVSGLPAGSLDVIIVDVLLSGSCSRRCHRLSDLDDGLFAGSCDCCAVSVWKVGIYAGRIEFCSHLLPQGQSHDFIAYWQLAQLFSTLSSPFQGFWKQKEKRQKLHDPAI